MVKKILLLSLIIHWHSIHSTSEKKQLASETADENTWITIFIHGSMGDTLKLRHLIKLFSCDINDSHYKKNTLKRRNEAGWWRYQPAQAVGLRKIHTNEKIRTAAQLFAKLYDEMQHEFFPEQTTIGYYTYGWSGLVNHKERMHTGKLLYTELKELVENLKPKYPHLKIRIIAYSHGANVALNMTYALNEDSQEPPFMINELIMIGTPVQREHDCQVMDPFFKHVYNIYSRADNVQHMDIFSGTKLISRRKFRNNNNCNAQEKVQQIEIKITTPAHKKNRRSLHSTKRIDQSPGHIELWHFQELHDYCGNGVYKPPFEAKLYRRSFPLHPVPTAVFIPGIIKKSPYQETIFELQPDRGKAIIQERYYCTKQEIDFLTPKAFTSIRNQATPGKK